MSLFGGHTLDTAYTPQDLIPGNPDVLDTTIAGLIALGVSGQDAGSGMTRLCTGEGWTGPAAEGFRAAFHMEPGRWSSLGQALTDAGQALKPYRDAVRAAQGEAAVAMEEWRHAQQATATATASYQRVRDVYDAAGLLGRQAGPLPSFTDPGAAGRAAAEARLAAARTRVEEAALAVMRVLADARDALPPEPGVWTRFGEGFVDTFDTFGTQAADFAGGAVDTTISMVGSVEKLNANSAYNLTHPQQYQHRLDEAGQVVVNVVKHPVTTMQSMVDSAKQAWSHDPGRAAGSLVPAVVLGVATGGAGDAAAAGTELADVAAGELETVAQAAGQDTIAAADTASGGVAESSVNATPRWGSWDFGPTGSGDVQAAGEIQDSGAGLAQAEHDLSGVHVHLDPAPPTQNPATTGAGDAARFETPAHSVSRPTQWGSFGGLDRPAAALTTDPAAVADSDVANMVNSAGSGLSRVERDLSQIHVRPLEVSHVDPGPGNSGNLLPDRSVGGFDLTPPSATNATPIPTSRPTLAARLPPDYTDRTYAVDSVAQRAYLDRYPPSSADLQWLSEIRAHWPESRGLTDSDLLALHQYKTSAYQLNAALRSGNVARMEALDPEIRATASALNKLPDYHGLVVRARGVNLSPDQVEEVLRSYEPGTVVQEPSFTSTDKQPPGYGMIEYRIVSHHGKDISPMMGQDTGVQEVIFPPGSHFRVEDRVFNPMTEKWQIYLTNVEG